MVEEHNPGRAPVGRADAAADSNREQLWTASDSLSGLWAENELAWERIRLLHLLARPASRLQPKLVRDIERQRTNQALARLQNMAARRRNVLEMAQIMQHLMQALDLTPEKMSDEEARRTHLQFELGIDAAAFFMAHACVDDVLARSLELAWQADMEAGVPAAPGAEAVPSRLQIGVRWQQALQRLKARYEQDTQDESTGDATANLAKRFTPKAGSLASVEAVYDWIERKVAQASLEHRLELFGALFDEPEQDAMARADGHAPASASGAAISAADRARLKALTQVRHGIAHRLSGGAQILPAGVDDLVFMQVLATRLINTVQRAWGLRMDWDKVAAVSSDHAMQRLHTERAVEQRRHSTQHELRAKDVPDKGKAT